MINKKTQQSIRYHLQVVMHAACPVLMNSMGLLLHWLYSINTDTGFFPPGRERDSGGRGASTVPSTSTLVVRIASVPSAGTWDAAGDNKYIFYQGCT